MKTTQSHEWGSLKYARVMIAALFVAMGLTAGNAIATIVTFTSSRDNTILNGVSGADSYTTSNFGGVGFMGVGYLLNGTDKSLVGFNVAMPSNPYVVNSVTLRLYLYLAQFGTDSGTLPSLNNEVYAISSANGDWVEGTGTSFALNAPGSTWNYKSSSSFPWAGSAGLSTAATDYNSTLLSSVTFNRSSLPSVNSAVDFTFTGTSAQLTTLIQGWAVSMPGLLLQTSTPDPGTGMIDRMDWYTREETTSGTGAYTPQLIVDFTPVPEPSTWLLLVVGGGFLWHKRRH
jgi:hypothetical protein